MMLRRHFLKLQKGVNYNKPIHKGECAMNINFPSITKSTKFKMVLILSITIFIIFMIFMFSGIALKYYIIENVKKIAENKSVGLSSYTPDYIKANQDVYNSIVNMKEAALPTLLKEIGDNKNYGLEGVIIAQICTDITGKGNQKDWYSAKDWFDKYGKDLYVKYVGEYKDSKA
jgi:hypothetical protein